VSGGSAIFPHVSVRFDLEADRGQFVIAASTLEDELALRLWVASHPRAIRELEDDLLDLARWAA
jgi:hypothetical protein